MDKELKSGLREIFYNFLDISKVAVKTKISLEDILEEGFIMDDKDAEELEQIIKICAKVASLTNEDFKIFDKIF